MEGQYKIFILAGTHWDREWYQSFQGFRYRLVAMVDDMMQKLEEHPELTFVFDGQTIVLEDYLEIAPENKERLTALIRAGRIVIGPWYCMPDEFNLSGESLIHNLQMGHAISQNYGVNAMKNGYICDIFGHAAQLPQIFSGFDIQHCVLGRGTNEHTTPSHFLWEAPDGTRCAAFKLADAGGYGDYYFSVLCHYQEAETEEEKDELVRGYIEKECTRSAIPVLLLMDAEDHCHLHAENVEIMERIRRLYPESVVTSASLDDFSREVERYWEQMPVRQGELTEPAREFGSYLHLIPNTVSSRRDLKYRNDRCQTLMEKWTLPVTAISNLCGHGIRKSYGDLAYRYLIQNHPHDSICGCSIDQVHRDMGYRFDQCEGISGEVLKDAARAYRTTMQPKENGKAVLSVFNPLPYRRKELISVDVVLKDFPCRRKEPFGYESINNYRLIDASGREVPYHIETNIRDTHAQHPLNTGDLQTISFVADLAPMGVTEYELRPEKYPVRYMESLRTSPSSAENRYLRLRICDNGTLEITDKITGRSYRNLLRFTDSADIGDGWFMCAPVEDRMYTSDGMPTSISVISDGPAACTFRVVKEMKLPRCLSRFDRQMPRLRRSEEMETLRLTSDVTLGAEERMVRIHTTVDNRVRDHRLKAEFETGMAGDYFASEAFCYVSRPCGRDHSTQNWKECDQVEKACSGIIGKRDAAGGLAILSAGGVHECAGYDDPEGTLAFTMLRCVEQTVNTDFEPDGQLQGKHEFTFLLMPLDDTVGGDRLQQAQDCAAAGVKSVVTCTEEDYEARRISFMEAEGVCYSIAKLPENGGQDTLIVRVYNPQPEAVRGTLRFDREIVSARKVNMNEEYREDAACSGNELPLPIGPWRVETYEIVLKNSGR